MLAFVGLLALQHRRFGDGCNELRFNEPGMRAIVSMQAARRFTSVTCRSRAIACRDRAVACRPRAVACRSRAIACRSRAVACISGPGLLHAGPGLLHADSGLLHVPRQTLMCLHSDHLNALYIVVHTTTTIDIWMGMIPRFCPQDAIPCSPPPLPQQKQSYLQLTEEVCTGILRRMGTTSVWCIWWTRLHLPTPRDCLRLGQVQLWMSGLRPLSTTTTSGKVI